MPPSRRRWRRVGTPSHSESGPRRRAIRAVEEDFKFLKSWCDGDWGYVGIDVTVYREGIALVTHNEHATWGVESNTPGSDNAHLNEVADDLLPEALDAARKKLAALFASMVPEQAPGMR